MWTILLAPCILVLFFIYLRWASFSAAERKEQMRPVLDEMYNVNKKLDELKATID